MDFYAAGFHIFMLLKKINDKFGEQQEYKIECIKAQKSKQHR